MRRRRTSRCACASRVRSECYSAPTGQVRAEERKVGACVVEKVDVVTPLLSLSHTGHRTRRHARRASSSCYPARRLVGRLKPPSHPILAAQKPARTPKFKKLLDSHSASTSARPSGEKKAQMAPGPSFLHWKARFARPRDPLARTGRVDASSGAWASNQNSQRVSVASINFNVSRPIKRRCYSTLTAHGSVLGDTAVRA